MPIPFILGAIAVGAGLVGAKKAMDASDKNSQAKRIQRESKKIFERAKRNLQQERETTDRALATLGRAKIDILHSSITRFVDTFGKIHHVELTGSQGMDELAGFEVNNNTLRDMRKLGSLATQIASGAVEGLAGGGLVALGAYGAVGLLAHAGTGAAIAGLSGVAATNATLAWLGGGTLAAGGLGVAGGTAVLGGLVAGPAIALMGFAMDSKADENLDRARSNRAKARRAAEEMDLASDVCSKITKRADMFTRLMADVDTLFQPLIGEMETIVRQMGTDYRNYSKEAKKTIAMVLSTASVVKTILDTPILTQKGNVTTESLTTYNKVENFLSKVQS